MKKKVKFVIWNLVGFPHLDDACTHATKVVMCVIEKLIVASVLLRSKFWEHYRSLRSKDPSTFHQSVLFHLNFHQKWTTWRAWKKFHKSIRIVDHSVWNSLRNVSCYKKWSECTHTHQCCLQLFMHFEITKFYWCLFIISHFQASSYKVES